MSKICIVVIKNHNYLETDKIKEQIKMLFNNCGLGVFFEVAYSEPFLERYKNDEHLIFSISDNFEFDNCEMFLLPDRCKYNGQTNNIPFEKRMCDLKRIIEIILSFCHNIEIFIGDSGTNFEDFQFENIDLDCFEKFLINKLNSFITPDICLKIDYS